MTLEELEAMTADQPMTAEHGFNHFAAAHMSAFGTKQTRRHTQPMSAFGGKADMALTSSDVRF
jgi:hypothetical protein